MPSVNHQSARFYVAFLLVLPLALLWRWLFLGEVLFWGTLMLQFWPWYYLVKMSLLAGEWPLWNPLLGNGAPLLANLQTGVFYPLNLLYLLLPIEHGLTFSVVLHLALAGLWMFFYVRRLGLQPFAATLSALTYMLSGYIVGRTQFAVMVNAAAWLPLLLWLGDRLATRRRRLDILWLALALAVQLLAGHAQLWFYSLWLIGPYVIFRSWPQRSRPVSEPASQPSNVAKDNTPVHSFWGGRFRLHPSLTYPLLGLTIAVTLAVLLSAVQLLPTAEFANQSPRSSGAERTFALTYSFWPWRLLTLLAPNFFGHPAEDNYWGYANYWEDHAYLGILPFLLALIGVWNYGMRKAWGPDPADEPQASSSWRVVPFFAAVIPISLILAMGWNTPIYLWVFDFVPGFAFFQAPARLLIWYTAAMAVLAGVGAQSFKLTPASRRGWQRLLVAAIGLIIAGVAGSFILTGRSQTFLTATTMLGLGLAAATILLLQRPKRGWPARERVWQGGVLALVALDLLWAAWPLLPTIPAAIFRQPIASATFLQTRPQAYRFYVDETFDYNTKFEGYFRFQSFGPNDLSYWQSLKETLIPNLGVYVGLASSNNYDPLVVGRWQRLTDLLKEAGGPQQAKLLALMNIGYFIDDGSVRVGPTVYTNEIFTIQQVPEPLPRAYFVSQVFPAKSEAEAVSRLTSPDFDYHREVIIMGGAVELEALRQTQGQAEEKRAAVTVIEQRPNRVSLAVDAPEAGFVILTDVFFRGWQATLDGQPAQIWPANLAFRAVAVEAGTHEIIFSYRPRSFTIGLWVSVITLVLIIITGFWLVKNDYKHHSYIRWSAAQPKPVE
jgi:hypothetical protein